MNNTTRNLSPAVRLAAGIAFALVALLMLLQPANGEAHMKAKFGADLSQPGIDAVDAPELCPLGGSCTRVQSYYNGPPHAGMVPFAPFNGTMTKVRLIAENPGKFKIQMIKRGMGTESQVTRQGPTIRYEGTGSVETFKVDVKIKQGEWLGLKTKAADTLSCDPVSAGEEFVYEPSLTLGGPLTIASGTYTCTELVGATAIKG